MSRRVPIVSYYEKRKLPSETAGQKADQKSVLILRWMILFALMGLFVVGIQNAYPALTQSDLFSLERISVEGNWLLTRKEVVKQSGLETGGNLFEADLSTATEGLTSHPMIRNALLMRRPPVGLEIWIEERRPLALISTPGGLLGIDEGATTFPLPQVPLDLPTVTGIAEREEAEQIEVLNNLTVFLNELEAATPDFLNEVSEIHVVSSSEARVFTVGDGLELRMRFEDAGAQVQSFTAYVSAERLMDEHPAFVDLRFRDQVIVRKR